MSGEERSCWVISIQHISEETSKFLLETDPLQWPVAGGVYGNYGVFVTMEWFSVQTPPDLRNVITVALERGYDMILLDQNGEITHWLPVYPWL